MIHSFLFLLALGAPEQRAIEFLLREVPAWPAENQCFSCHNNGYAARALFAATRAGHSVPPESIRVTLEWLARDLWNVSRHIGRAASAGGRGSEAVCRRARSLLPATVWPRFERAPRMRVDPHLGFDFAIPTTSLLISAMTRGRPGCFRRSL